MLPEGKSVFESFGCVKKPGFFGKAGLLLSNVRSLGAGLPTPPTAGLHELRKTFGRVEWLGQETGHSAMATPGRSKKSGPPQREPALHFLAGERRVHPKGTRPKRSVAPILLYHHR